MDISESNADPRDAAANSIANREDKPRRSGSGLAFFALLIALGSAAGTGYLWWSGASSTQAGAERQGAEIARLDRRDAQLSTQLQELRKELDSLPGPGDEDQLRNLQAGLSDDRAQLEGLRQSLQEQVAVSRSLQSATDAMHGRLLAAEAALAEARTREPDARGELDLAEVDYLLRLASERLQLFSDPLAADRALGLADSHLAAMDNPAYLGVRQAIAASRRELAAVDTPDDLGIAARLDSIQAAIPDLPFRTAAKAAPDPAPAVEPGWWEKLKGTFASLVTVRRSTEEENRRISLEDKDYIRARMWLQAEIARLALMRRDEPAFRDALARLQASLAEWFDPADAAVSSLGATAAELAALDIAITWPDISGPWVELRALGSVQAGVDGQ